MNRAKSFFTLLTLVVGIFLILQNTQEPGGLESQYNSPEERGAFEVINVFDGDTFSVYFQGEEQRLRIIGIDTPEMNYENNDPECLAPEAKTFLLDLTEGEVLLEFDESQGQRDQYQRLLAHVFADEVNIAELLLENGLAREYTYNKAYRYQDKYRRAQKRAQESQQGLWNKNTCNE